MGGVFLEKLRKQVGKICQKRSFGVELGLGGSVFGIGGEI